MACQHCAVRQHEFLHVHAEEAIGGKFIDLPDSAKGHGEAESKQAHKEGGQAHSQMPVPVQDGHHHQPEKAHHHAAAEVADAVPLGHQVVKAPDLPQENGAVQENNIEAVEQARQLEAELSLQNTGQMDGNEAQNALHKHQQIIRFRVEPRLAGAAAAAEDHAQNQIDNRHQKAERYGDVEEFSKPTCLFHLPCSFRKGGFPLFLNIS